MRTGRSFISGLIQKSKTVPTSFLSPAQAICSSSVQTVTLSNFNEAPLPITGITATGDFTQTNDCGTNLDSGEQCTISVTFKPTATGARDGSLTISDSEGGVTGSTQSVSLSGAGIQPVANSPASGGSASAPSPPGPGQAKD